MTLTRAIGLLAGGLVLLTAGRASAQSLVTARFGENADVETDLTTGRTLSLGFTRIFGDAGLDLAAGLPLEAERGTRWGAVGGWVETAFTDRDPFGVLATAAAFYYSDAVLDASGTGLTSFLRAHAAAPVGPAELRLRGTVRAGATATGDASLRRVIGGPGARADLRAGPLSLEAAADWWFAPEGAFPELSAHLVFASPRLRARVGASGWLHEDLPGTGWLASVQVALSDRLALIAHGSREPTDLLLWTPSRQSWSIGLRMRAGAVAGGGVAVPTVVEAGRDVVFELAAAPLDGPPALAGTFSEWQPLPMERRGDRWVLRLELPPGMHEFSFVAVDGSWFVPEETPGRKPDGFGGFVATVIVR